MDALQLKVLTDELKDLPESYLYKILQYINILKASEKTEELKPFTQEEFMARYEISKKQIEEGNLIAMEDAEKYLKAKTKRED